MLEPSDEERVCVRFALPSAKLSPFFSAYSWTDIRPAEPSRWVEDLLLPAWPILWFSDLSWEIGRVDDAECFTAPAYSVSGPFTQSGRFRSKEGRIWGLGLLPLGWASLFDVPASAYANEAVDGDLDPAFSRFVPLAKALAASSGDFDEELAIIEAFLEEIPITPAEDAERITDINQALLDPQISTVGGLADRVEMNIRSLERASKRAFGFTPLQLLGRQRFLRSLTRFMTEGNSNWLDVMDDQYYDQAHFTRDFKRLMGHNPKDYARMEKPIFTASMQARAVALGKAVQGLHEPVPTKTD